MNISTNSIRYKNQSKIININIINFYPQKNVILTLFLAQNGIKWGSIGPVMRQIIAYYCEYHKIYNSTQWNIFYSIKFIKNIKFFKKHYFIAYFRFRLLSNWVKMRLNGLSNDWDCCILLLLSKINNISQSLEPYLPNAVIYIS